MRCFRFLVAFSLLLSLGACRKPAVDLSSPWPELTPLEEEAAAKVLVGVTAGIVAKREPIEMRFAWPMVSDEELGRKVEAPWFVIEPGLDGELRWKDPQTLQYLPSEDIRSDVHYTAVLDLAALTGDKALPKVPFGFTARPQDVAWRTDAFAQDAGLWKLSGQVSFNEAPDTAAWKDVVKATQGGKELAASWSGAATRWSLSVSGIQRNGTDVLLEWGKGAGVSKGHVDTLDIPAAGELGILGVRDEEGSGDQARFSILFSDPLDAESDGKARLDQEGWSASIDGNRLVCEGNSSQGRTVTVQLDPGLSSESGQKLSKSRTIRHRIGDLKPSARFLRSGAILPTSAKDKLPFETMNLTRVAVKVTAVATANIPEFLAESKMAAENYRISRLGRVVLDTRLHVGGKPGQPWTGGLDLSKLLGNGTAGLFVIELRKVREGNLYGCAEEKPAKTEAWKGGGSGSEESSESSEGDGEGDGEDYHRRWEDRNDPCKPSFWDDWYGQVARVNVLVSDLGLMAFQDAQGQVSVAATNLLSTESWKGVEVEVLDPSDRLLAKGVTDDKGLVSIKAGTRAALVRAHVVDKGYTHQGYVRLKDEEARNMSRFDVSGEASVDGMRMFLYTERGVYRPGDSLFIGCLLRGEDGKPVERLPMRFSLKDPQGRVVASNVLRAAEDGHFGWRTATRTEDPTGRWQIVAEAGPATAVKSVMIETVRPNRLKIENDFEGKVFGVGSRERAHLSARWLSGGSAAALSAKVSAVLAPRPMSVKTLSDFVFDNPTARKVEIPEKTLWEGRLDGQGKSEFSFAGLEGIEASGLLTATITTRVFEEGGQSSVDACGAIVSPFSHLAGLHVAGVDRWGWAGADKPLRIELASVTPKGVAAKGRPVEVEIWSRRGWWWWENGENQTNFTSRDGVTKVATLRGVSGSFVKWQPEGGGTLLVLVKDLQSGHVSGKFLEIWGGGGEEGSEAKAPSLLPLVPVKDSVEVGQKLSVRFPGAPKGRALIQVMRGRRILSQEWIALRDTSMEWSTPATAAMSPGVYVQVNLIQPYPPQNERPLRVWGIVPVAVVDPATRLKLEVKSPAEIRPNSQARIEVRNLSGRKGRMVLAVVDEGLLDLTRFKTPDPWKGLHAKEALSVRSWDLFDDVFGAWAGKLDGILAIGGDENRVKNPGSAKNNLFPPMVWVSQPMDLPAGGTTVTVPIGQYTGSVRVMAVASSGEATGSAEATSAVRAPVMVLPTAPRALSPGDRATVPVTLFSSQAGEVSVSLKTTSPLQTVGSAVRKVQFGAAGSAVATFEIQAVHGLGEATLEVTAQAAHGTATQGTPVLVRAPGQPRMVAELGLAGQTGWSLNLAPLFLPGTSSARLDISAVGSLGIENRIQDLLEYPHGCVEQTTSGAFPQLFLGDLLPDATAAQKKRAEANVRAAIERLNRFQTPSGGLSLWAGESRPYEWGTLWAARFLALARARGYDVPATQWDPLFAHLSKAAKSWTPGVYASAWDTVTQVDRLDVLALAGKAELAEMNRLKGAQLPGLSRWILAAAYASAGQQDVAAQLARTAGVAPLSSGRMLGDWLGSPIRDQGRILEAMVRTGQTTQAPALFQNLRKSLASSYWFSTQEAGVTLWSFSSWLGKLPKGAESAVEWRLAGGSWNRLTTTKGTAGVSLPDAPTGLLEVRSLSAKPVEVLVSRRGIDAPGMEPQTKPGNLQIVRTWRTASGAVVDPSRVPQGTELVCEVTVANRSGQKLTNVALSQLFPGGMEIRNDRLEASSAGAETAGGFERVEFRDDRVIHYMTLGSGDSRKVQVKLRAAWAGKYILPAAAVEALYDAQYSAWAKGGSCEIVPK